MSCGGIKGVSCAGAGGGAGVSKDADKIHYRNYLLSIGINPYTDKIEDKELYIAYLKEKNLYELYLSLNIL